VSQAGDEMVDKFHAHLDGCRRCREEAFNLCAEGRRLLEGAAAGSMLDPKQPKPDAATPRAVAASHGSGGPRFSPYAVLAGEILGEILEGEKEGERG
jgi:Zn-dependent alcohol dehydrogenase